MDVDKDYEEIIKFKELVNQTELTEDQTDVLEYVQEIWQQKVKSCSMAIMLIEMLIGELMGRTDVWSGNIYSYNISDVECSPSTCNLRIIFYRTYTDVFEVSIAVARDRMFNRGTDAKFLPEFYVLEGVSPWGGDIFDVDDVVECFKVIKVLSTYKATSL